VQSTGLHFKGFALDTVIAAITQGRPYRHLMGFTQQEASRATRDTKHNTPLRTGSYPLMDWGWTRERAVRYLEDTYHETWIKSACTYCPFALATEAGRESTVAQFVADPHAGLLALAMEFTATCLNPTQGLINGKRLLTLLRHSPGTAEVLRMFDEYLTAVPWAVYDVRRTFTPRSDGRFNHARAVKILHTGTGAAMRACLREHARATGTAIIRGDSRFPDDQHPRLWVRHRDHTMSTVADAEHFVTVSPATAITKTGPAFPTAWAAAAQFQLAV